MPSPTVSYSIVPLHTTIVSPGILSYDIVGLSNGGFSIVWNDGEPNNAQDNASYYDLHGNVAGAPFTHVGLEGADAQLTNNFIVSTWQATSAQSPATGNGIFYVIETPGSVFVKSGTIEPGTNVFAPDVAALSTGGSVIVDQKTFMSTDFDIEVHMFDSVGNDVNDFSVDQSSALDANASVIGLTGGGFAVAWQRVAGDGSTSVWVAVYNANGSVHTAPEQIDPSVVNGGAGTINRDVSLTALKSGGFAVTYEDNGWDSSQTDITIATFDKNGNFQHFLRADSLSTDDTQAAATTLSNGLVLTSFTNDFFDFDVRAALIDPATNALLSDPAHPFTIVATTDNETDASVSALPSLAQFVVGYTDTTVGTIKEATYQLVRTTIGTSAADIITGDDAVDVINGGRGADALAGGPNADIFTFDAAALADATITAADSRFLRWSALPTTTRATPAARD